MQVVVVTAGPLKPDRELLLQVHQDLVQLGDTEPRRALSNTQAHSSVGSAQGSRVLLPPRVCGCNLPVWLR